MTSASRLGVPALPQAGVGCEGALAALDREGCGTPRSWRHGPGDRYDVHAHELPKVLLCIEGSITFHTEAGDLELRAGDRLDLPSGIGHSATVGPSGCACVEAWGA